ncbi:MAG: GNAT family N-acetyltransferase [Spirochaetia bacterium]|nr:GNAT family N-acetyltransferase [Spirochaetia bacterium]
MREHIQIRSKPYIFFTPENDEQFEAILNLTRTVHGEGAVALCRSFDAGIPGMCRDDWYGLARLDDWPQGDAAPGRVVSTLCRIPTVWTCADAGAEVQLPSAELGMVASAEDARGLGLSTWLMKRFQADSIKAGFSLSSIQGIPYFYRRFGYEYAVPLLPKIVLAPGQVHGRAVATQVREAGFGDISLMSGWFTEVSRTLGVRADRSEEHWMYLMDKAQASFETAVERRILLDRQGRPAGWLGFQRECFGPTLAIAEASLPDKGSGWTAQAMLALADSIRAEEGLPHVTVLLPRSHPVSVAAAELGGELCREYAWQIAILDKPAFFGCMRPVIEARLRKGGWEGRTQCLNLDLYAGGLRFDWDGKRLEIAWMPDPALDTGPEQLRGQSLEDIDTMPEKPVSAFPPELLSPLALGYRTWQELGHCRRDVMIRPEDRGFMDVLFPVMASFIYPLF